MSKQNTGRKFFATAATAALVASAIVPVASAAEFTDADKIASWAKDAVEELAAKEVITGNPDGSFNPAGTVTRAQAAKMFTVALDLDTTGTEGFTDVKEGQWFQEYVIAVVNAGIVNGMTTTEFAPNGKLTREQAAKMIVEAYGFEGEADLSQFTDAKTVAGKWSEAYLSTAVANGVINGKGDKLAATDSISRQEFAVMLTRAIDAATDNSAELVAAVEEATKALDEAVKALKTEVKVEEIEAAKAGVTTAETAIVAVEKALEAAKEVVTEEQAAKVNEAIAAAKKAIETTKAVIAKAEEDAKVLAVESVTQLNATEILVKYNKEVNKDSAIAAGNYTVETKAPFTVTTNAVADVELQEDGKSAIVRLTNVLTPAVVYNVTVQNVVDKKYAKLAKFETTFTATEAAAPSLAKVEYVGGELQVTFKEEVSFAKAIVKVDGVSIPSNAFTAVATDAGTYTYKATLTAAANLTEGNHSVSIVGLENKAGKEASTLTGTFTISKDVTAPTVSKVTASETTANEFTIEFNEAVTKPTVKVTKGSTVYTATTTNDTSSVTSKTWTVKIDDTIVGNELFPTGVTQAVVSYEVSAFKDTANLVGTTSTGSVTLSKDANVPAVKSANLNTIAEVSTATVITVPFTEAITTASVTNVSVKDPDGILQTAAVTVSGENLVLTIANHANKQGTYEIILPAGVVKDGSNNKNAATTTFVTKDASTAGVLELSTSAIATSNTVVSGVNSNVITVDFGEEMTETALNVANYSLDNAALPAGTTIGFVGTKNKVQITLPSTFVVSTDADYKFAVSKDLTTKAGKAVRLDDSAATASTLQLVKTITLKDNKAPELTTAKLLNNGAVATDSANQIELTFNEALTAVGTSVAAGLKDDFVVKVNGATVAHDVVANSANSNKIVLSIDSYNTAQTITVELAESNLQLVDLNGNVINKGAALTATK